MWTFEYTDTNSDPQAGSPCGAATFKTPWDAQKELTRKLWEPTTDPDESGNEDGNILYNYHINQSGHEQSRHRLGLGWTFDK